MSSTSSVRVEKREFQFKNKNAAVWKKKEGTEWWSLTVVDSLVPHLSNFLESLEQSSSSTSEDAQALRARVRWEREEEEHLAELIARFPAPQDLPKIRANFKSPFGYNRKPGVLNNKIRELRGKMGASTLTPPTYNERQHSVDSDTPRQSSVSSTDSQAGSTPTSEPESKKPRVESV